MSAETIQNLNRFQLISTMRIEGAREDYFTVQEDGTVRAWHYQDAHQGEPNHYPGFIPVTDVERRLFNWEANEAPLTTLVEIGSPAALALDPSLERLTSVYVGGKGYWVVNDPTRKVISRSDTGLPLGVFRDGYQPHPYREWLLENVASILSEAQGELGITSAGLLKDGAVAYVQVQPLNGTTIGGDKLFPMLTASGSFDGSLASNYVAGTWRVACDNSLTSALFEQGANRVAYRHTRNSGMRIGDAREALGILFEVQEAFEAGVEKMMNTPVTDGQFWDIVANLYPQVDAPTERVQTNYLNRQVALVDLWENDDRVAPYKGTAWGAFQTHSTYDQHEARFRRGRTAGNRYDRNMLATVTGKASARDAEIAQAIDKVLVGA